MRYEEIEIGARVKSLVSFPNIPKDSNGEVVELYSIGKRHRGFTVFWHGPGIEGIRDGFSESELRSLEFLN